MATSKKTAAPKTVKSVTRTLTTAKNTAAAPAVLAKAGKQFGADAAGVPGSKKPTKAPKAKPTVDLRGNVGKSTLAVHNGSKAALLKPKRTVSVPDIGIAGVPLHTVHDVAGLMKTLGDFPRGSTFTTDIYHGKSWMKVYNLRGRLIAEIKREDKKAKK